MLKTPVELRVLSPNVIKQCIREGVRNGLFGIGNLANGNIEIRHFKEDAPVYLSDDEVIIKSELCTKPAKEEYIITPSESPEIQISKEKAVGIETMAAPVKKYSRITLKLNVPVGQLSTIARIASFLKNKFDQCNIEVHINTEYGEITSNEYENILEAIKQANIRIKEEFKE